MTTFTLTGLQAAYVVGALRLTLNSPQGLSERDRTVIENIMHELAAPMELDDKVRKIINDSSIKLKASVTAWSSGGVVLESGTRFRFIYRGTLHEGAIIDAFWCLGDDKFFTPSQMIKHLVPKTSKGKESVINAWLAIDVMIPNSNQWVRMDSLRKFISYRGRRKI